MDGELESTQTDDWLTLDWQGRAQLGAEIQKFRQNETQKYMYTKIYILVLDFLAACIFSRKT